MNLLGQAIIDCRERDGAAADDRPSYVTDALTQDKRVGFGNGLPIADPSEEYDPPKLGESTRHLYDHYPDNPLAPESGNVLEEIAESDLIHSTSDVAAELGENNLGKVGRALDLHDVDCGCGTDPAQAPHSGNDGITLPSGETLSSVVLPAEPWQSPFVLAQLLATDGLSTEETALFLSEQIDGTVDPPDVREAAEEYHLLDGEGVTESRGRQPRVDRRTTVEGNLSLK